LVTPTNSYPAFGVEKLRGHIGQQWADLVEYVSKLPVTDPNVMALSLTVRRIQKHFGHQSTTCREPLCPVCAADIMAAFPGTEQDLIEMFYTHLEEINATVKAMQRQPRPSLRQVSVA
jgi:hypothetical protein